MHLPIILAHGALGGWDEIIFLGVAAIFITMMGISWVRSRNNTMPIEPEKPAATDEATPPAADPNQPDHFRLE